MLVEERWQLIKRWLNEDNSITLEKLSKRLNVSLMTVRRDLNMLQKQGFLKRVRGGAVKINKEFTFKSRFTARKTVNVEEKKLIAQYAVENFVDENDIIALEGGTTVSLMAPYLNIPNLKIITNGLNIINTISEFSQISKLMCCGGSFFEQEFTFVGPNAEEFYKEFRVHKCFFGADGFTFEDGAGEFNLEEIGVKQAMLRCSNQHILLIDSSKFGTPSFVPAVPCKNIDIIITDSKAPKSILQSLKTLNIEVHIAK